MTGLRRFAPKRLQYLSLVKWASWNPFFALAGFLVDTCCSPVIISILLHISKWFSFWWSFNGSRVTLSSHKLILWARRLAETVIMPGPLLCVSTFVSFWPKYCLYHQWRQCTASSTAALLGLSSAAQTKRASVSDFICVSNE